MDISILLMLQEFRNGAGAFLRDFLTKMTDFGDMNVVLVMIAIIYWCISKIFGTYLLMGWCSNRIVNGFLKVIACVYRPWVRDAGIVPDKQALAAATGYSFPSGHSMNGATVYGGGMLDKKLPKGFRILLGVIMILVAFSRIYLGVHTPQDVIVGTLAGLLVMWLTAKLMKWLDDNPSKDKVVALIGIMIAIAVAIYAANKSYPVDYDESGNILVDGAKMANDTFKAIGWCIGFLSGWMLERKYLNFKSDVSISNRVIRLVCGLFGYYIVTLIITPVFKQHLSAQISTTITCFLQMFYVSFVFPFMIKKFEKE